MDFIRNSILKDDEVKNKAILIVGVGATGSHLAIELVKLGFTDITIYDPGVIKEHNVTNQAYPITAAGKPKQDTLQQLIKIRYGADISTLMTQPSKGYECDICFNCVDEASSREHYRGAIIAKDIFIETAFDVYSSDLFLIKDTKLLEHIPTGEGNTSEVVSACGSRLTVSASINAFIGSVTWALIHHLNGDLDDANYNSRLTIAHFNPVHAEKLVIGVRADEFFG